MGMIVNNVCVAVIPLLPVIDPDQPPIDAPFGRLQQNVTADDFPEQRAPHRRITGYFFLLHVKFIGADNSPLTLIPVFVL